MAIPTWVEFLGEAFFISYCSITFGKSINLFIFPLAMGKYKYNSESFYHFLYGGFIY